jgi:SpoVK/Ycf46/Vps4 family AAA+-type ATPase
MGWDFLVVDTSVFLADGLGNVAARETPGIGMESRMLTTAMLTAINDLRRAKRSVFFLATNRLRAFDSAITRPGRFDMQLFVGTPNLEARSILFREELAKLSLDQDVTDAALESYRSFLSKSWAETAMFMNYLEGAQFSRACADIVKTGARLSHDDMNRILKAQAAVMTVRGAVRDEFIASMDMSRL